MNVLPRPWALRSLLAAGTIAAVAAAGSMSFIAKASPDPSVAVPVVGASPVAPGETTSRLVIRLKAAASPVDLKSVDSLSRLQAVAGRAIGQLAVRKDVPIRMVRVAGVLGRDIVADLGREAPLAEMQAIARRLRADPQVESVSVDARVRPAQRVPAMPADPYASSLWALAAPGFTAPYAPGLASAGSARFVPAWLHSTGAGVTVAVIDTGIVPHSDLAGQVIGGHDFIANIDAARDGDGRDADPSDPGDACVAGNPRCGGRTESASWHGARVAGIIAARAGNDAGIAGAAPDVKILDARVLGAGGGFQSDINDAILWSAGLPVAGVPLNPVPAKVINLSLGAYMACQPSTQDAVDRARAQGAVIVAAAGNDGAGWNYPGGAGEPANCAGVIAVGAHTRSGDLADYSNWGAGVALTAPGGGACKRMTAACLDHQTVSTSNAGTLSPAGETVAHFNGTSAASPHVAAAAALLLAVRPDLGPDDVRSHLVSTGAANPHPAASWCAQPANAGRCGAGMLDARAAIEAALQGRIPTVSIDPMARDWVLSGTNVVLRARGASPVGRAVTYAWRQVGGTQAVMRPTSVPGEIEITVPGTRGPFSFEVRASDDLGTSGVARVSFRGNALPVLAPLDDRSVVTGAAMTAQAVATDADGDTLVHAIEQGPAGLVIDAATGRIGWPVAGAPGNYPVTVSVTDGLEGSLAQRTFDIAVTAASGDAGAQPAPPVSSAALRIVSREFQLPFDADGLSLGEIPLATGEGLRVLLKPMGHGTNTHTFTLKGGLPGMRMDAVTGEFVWDANIVAGTHVVTIDVSRVQAAVPRAVAPPAPVGPLATISFVVKAAGAATASAAGAGSGASAKGGGGAAGPLDLGMLLLALGALSRRMCRDRARGAA